MAKFLGGQFEGDPDPAAGAGHADNGRSGPLQRPLPVYFQGQNISHIFNSRKENNF